MCKLIASTANEAVAEMTINLARHYYKSPSARQGLRNWLNELEKPVTYSNQVIYRASQFHDFLTKLATE